MYKAYNPHIFLRDPSSAVVASNICSVVALGADDRSVSIWQTKSARPLVVAKEVFERQIMDLSWCVALHQLHIYHVSDMVIYSRVRTSDGLTLYAVSSDGTIAVFSFDPDELEGISPLSAQEQYLKKFGFTIPPLPDGFSHQPKQADTDTRMTPPPSPVRAQSVAAPSQDLGFGSSSNGGEHVNKLVAKRNTKKKRIQPTFMGTLTGSVPSAGSTVDPVSPASNANPAKPNGRSFHEITGITSSSRPPQSAAPPASESLPSASAYRSRSASEDMNSLLLAYPDDDIDMTTEVPISSLDANGQSRGGKRKASALDDERPGKPRTLGGDRVRDTVPVKELASGSRPSISNLVTTLDVEASGSGLTGRLPIPPLLTYLKATVEGSEDIFEGRNSEDGGE